MSGFRVVGFGASRSRLLTPKLGLTVEQVAVATTASSSASRRSRDNAAVRI